MQPVGLFYIRLREFVMRLGESGIYLDRVLKLNGGFAVLTTLKIRFTFSEVLLLHNVGVSRTPSQDRSRNQRGRPNIALYGDIHRTLARWKGFPATMKSYTFELEQSRAVRDSGLSDTELL
jgi:hypothetical protein